MRPNPIAYIASPLGFSEVGRFYYYTELVHPIKGIGFEIIDPWVLTSPKLVEAATRLPYGRKKKKAWTRLNPIIGKNNATAIESADLVVAVLDGVDVDSGTASEIGYAAALGKTIFGYRGDFRSSSDNDGSIVNLQVEYFIRQSGGNIVMSRGELTNALIAYREQLERSE